MKDTEQHQSQDPKKPKVYWVFIDVVVILICVVMLMDKLSGYIPQIPIVATALDRLQESIEKSSEEQNSIEASSMASVSREETEKQIEQETKKQEETFTRKREEETTIQEQAVAEETGRQNEWLDDTYILPDSDLRVISEEELQGLDVWELKLARNEIYARHGRRFKSQDLQNYFDEQSWYHGTIDAEAFDDTKMLNDIEKINLDTVMAMEDQLSAASSKAGSKGDENSVEVNLNNLGITDITPYLFDDIEILNCYGNPISDFTPIAKLQHLKTLNVSGTGLTSIDFLSHMTQLEILTIGENDISDISAIEKFTNLRAFDFWYSNVNDISVLSKLKSLEEVYMSYSNVTTLKPLINLPNLKVLSISGLTLPKSEYDEFVKKHPNCKIYQEGTKLV